MTGLNTFIVRGNPQVVTNGINGNPYIDFDGSGDYLEGNTSVYRRQVFMVAYAPTDSGVILSHAADTSGIFNQYSGRNSGGFFEFMDEDVPGDGLRSNNAPPDQFNIFFTNIRPNGLATDSLIFFNGASQTRTAIGSGGELNHGNFIPRIGRGTIVPATEDFSGNIAEIIVYGPTTLDVNARIRIQSYLAIKYGITIFSEISSDPFDYLDSSGNILFGHTSDSAFIFDVGGIGRDEVSGLFQTASRSINTDSMITMSGASSLDDGDFLLWGNNDDPRTETTSGLPAGVAKRLDRKWKVGEQGDTGTVDVTFHLSGVTTTGTNVIDYHLIMDTDVNFSSGATLYDATSFSGAGGTVVFEDIPFTDGNIFTLGTDANILGVDIVDASSVSVSAPSVTFSSLPFSFSSQTTTGTLGSASQKILVHNSTSTATWTLTVAATAITSVWSGAGGTFDFNDIGANATDTGDADTVGGRLTVDPSVATLAGKNSCSTTGVTLGSSTGFRQGVTNSITIAQGSGSASTVCEWTISGVSLSQTVPASQVGSSYSLNLVLSIVAS